MSINNCVCNICGEVVYEGDGLNLRKGDYFICLWCFDKYLGVNIEEDLPEEYFDEQGYLREQFYEIEEVKTTRIKLKDNKKK